MGRLPAALSGCPRDGCLQLQCGRHRDGRLGLHPKWIPGRLHRRQLLPSATSTTIDLAYFNETAGQIHANSCELFDFNFSNSVACYTLSLAGRIFSETIITSTAGTATKLDRFADANANANSGAPAGSTTNTSTIGTTQADFSYDYKAAISVALHSSICPVALYSAPARLPLIPARPPERERWPTRKGRFQRPL